MALLEHFPTGQIQQVGHIPGREPAFRRLGLALAQLFGRLEQGLPEPVVETHHQPGAGMAKGLQPLQHPLHVMEGVEGVGQQDHIEGLPFADRLRRDRFGVGADHAQLRVAGPGRLGQLGIQLNAHAMGWFEPRQQVAEAAADLQHPQPRRHQQLVQPLQVVVVGPVALVEAEGGAGGGHDFKSDRAWPQSSPMALATMRRVRRVSLVGSSWAARSSRGRAAPGLKR